jgi:hypothetical protein
MKKRRHISRRNKTFDSDKVSAPLVQWLNAMPDSDLHGMVRDLQSLDKLAKELNWSTLREEEKPTWREFERLRDSISSRMRQFATYSAISTNFLYLPLLQKGGSGSSVEYPVKHREWRFFPEVKGKCKGEGDGRYGLVRHPYQGSADPETAVFEFNQTLPFFAFEEIVRKQWGWRLQICDVCNRWFCARTSNQEYCSSPARCSKMKYDHSTKAKAKRQERREREPKNRNG